ncbi:hypothetical protein F4703DRAFT_1931469 [Phycomyces blakesleeanus]
MNITISDRRRSGKRTTLTSPVSTMPTTRWPTTTTTTTATSVAKEPESRQTEGDDRKSGWTDVGVSKKATTPTTSGFGPFVNTDHDPFAGMKQCVDYQQEIERLKTLVPKVEAKKRPSSRPLSAGAWNENTSSSPRPTGKSTSSKGNVSVRRSSPTARPMSSLGISSRTLDDNSMGTERVRSATAPHSPVSSKSSTPTISPTPSHSNISDGSIKGIDETSVSISKAVVAAVNTLVDTSVKKSEAESEAESEATTTSSTSSSVSAAPSQSQSQSQTEPRNPITEEEKARFLEFVRSWTGGWKGGWEEESVKKTAGSLWAEQSPWDFTPDRQRAHQPDPMTNSQPLMDELYWHSSAAQIVLAPVHRPVQTSVAPRHTYQNDLWRNSLSLHAANSAAAMRPYFHPKAQYQQPGYTT